MKSIVISLALLLGVKSSLAEEVKFKWDETKKQCLDSEGNSGLNEKYLGECGNLEAIDPTGKTISGISLVGANLKSAKLERTTLVNVDLSYANLTYSTLSSSFILDSKMIKTDLRSSYLKTMTLKNVVMKDILAGKIEGAAQSAFTKIIQSTFMKVSAVGADFLGVLFEKVHFYDSDMSNIKLKSAAAFAGITVSNTKFDGVDFLKVNWSYTKVNNSSFRGAKFSSLTFERAFVRNNDFTKADFTSVNFMTADISESLFKEATFKTSDLSNVRAVKAHFGGATFVDVNLEKAHISGATIPSLNSTKTSGAILDSTTQISPADLAIAKSGGALIHLDSISTEVQAGYVSAAGDFKFDLATKKCVNGSGAEGYNSGFVECGFVEKQTLDGALVAKGTKLNGIFLKEVTLKNSQIEDVSLVGARFETVTASNTSFARSLLSLAQIKNSSFSQIDFKNTAFDGVKATSIWFSNVSWAGSNLNGAILSRSIFENVVLTSTTARLSKFDSASFSGANLVDNVDFEGTDFSYVAFPNADFQKSFLFVRELTASTWTSCNLEGVVFNNPIAPGIDLTSAQASYTSFENADLRWAKFSKAVVQLSSFKGANATLSEWNGARAKYTDLRGANLSSSGLGNVESEGLQFARFSGATKAPISMPEAMGFFLMNFVFID